MNRATKRLFEAVLDMTCSEYGQLERVQTAIKTGADVNATDQAGRTPLQRVAIKGRARIAQMLIDRGAAIEVRDPLQQTPLHLAALTHQGDIAQLLINKGASIEARTAIHGQTPLHLAADAGYTALAKLLIEKGAEVDSQDYDHRTPLHLAARGSVSSAPRAWYKSVARLLIDKRADVNALTKERETPRDCAYAHKFHEMDALLENEGGQYSRRRACITVEVFEDVIPSVLHALEQGQLKNLVLKVRVFNAQGKWTD